METHSSARGPKPAKEVARSVEAFLAEGLGFSSPVWHAALVQERQSHGGTLVFAAVADPGGLKVAVKVYREPQRVVAEHRAALLLSRGPAAVAKPLLCDPERGFLVSEWVEGQSLANRLTNDGGQEGLRQAGRWLRRLHRPLRLRPSLYRPSSLLSGLHYTKAELPKGRPAVEREVYDAIVAALAREIGQSRAGLYRSVPQHGDFQPQNIIMSQTGPVAIDLAFSQAGSRYRDLAKMTVQLEVMGSNAASPGKLDPEQAKEAFLSAYGLKGQQAQSRLALTEGLELLRRWNVFVRDNPRQSPSAQRFIGALKGVAAKRGWLAMVLALWGQVELPEESRYSAFMAPAAVARG